MCFILCWPDFSYRAMAPRLCSERMQRSEKYTRLAGFIRKQGERGMTHRTNFLAASDLSHQERHPEEGRNPSEGL
jgi:hypothetical protein